MSAFKKHLHLSFFNCMFSLQKKKSARACRWKPSSAFCCENLQLSTRRTDELAFNNTQRSTFVECLSILGKKISLNILLIVKTCSFNTSM